MILFSLDIEREQNLLNFVGSRLEGGGSSLMISSTAPSRASTPQPPRRVNPTCRSGRFRSDFIGIRHFS
jgi:hypothetical protein